MNRLVSRFFAAACAAILSLPAVAQDAAWDRVVAAARKEGRVVVYNAANRAPYYSEVVKNFERKYGIAVETLDVRAAELSERIRTEQSSGRYLADLEQHGDGTIDRQLRDTDYVQPHGGVPNSTNIRDGLPVTNVKVPCFIQAYGILVNTNAIKPADEPKNWPDVLDPKWKGKILSDDLRPLGAGNTFFAVTNWTYGLDFHHKLVTQNLFFSRNPREDARRVARGEYPLYIPQNFAYASDLEGLPLKVIVPTDGVPYVLLACAVMKNAPHPNAARVFINHFIEVESQTIYANSWMLPVVNGVVEHVRPAAKRFAGAKLLGRMGPDDYEPMQTLAGSIYK